jgi:hypothetical protein
LSDCKVQKVADAILYEGYALYPYRPSNVKNRQRWTFGSLYPAAFAPRTGDRSSFQARVLIASASDPVVEVNLRFLHLVEEENAGKSWQTGMEREVLAFNAAPVRRFTFPAWRQTGEGIVQRQHQVDGQIEILCDAIGEGLRRLTLRVTNVTDMLDSNDLSRDEASLNALVSAHAILRVTGGQFVSLTDPPEEFRAATERCDNQGVWPVLAGEPGSRDCMLVSPIILSDYPEVAPESAGDLFDGAEIDEILTLRILTMTDSEKEEMRQTDERIRRILERTENLSPRQLMQLHGTLRNPHAVASDPGSKALNDWNPMEQKGTVESVRVFGIQLKRGDRVRLWPKKSADIMDLALEGQVAEIESVEVDYDDQIHLAVILDNDPGRDLGAMRQPGHRFFFSPEEVEPLGLDAELSQ